MELVEAGYLSPLIGVKTASKIDLSNVRTKAGDYVTSDLSQAASEEKVVQVAIEEICYLAKHRRSWLIFAVDRAHAAIVVDALRDNEIDTKLVLGNTPSDQRDQILKGFKASEFRALVNVGVLTTGFDAPNVDCVALMRPSQSKSLVVQMLGRGTRLFEGKSDCLVLDLAGNLESHVPLDGIPKLRPSRRLVDQELEAEAIAEQREAARREKERLAKHTWKPSDIDPMARYQYEGGTLSMVVERVNYMLIRAKKYPDRENLMVSYDCRTENGMLKRINKFVLIQYPGWPGREARAWFGRRGLNMPANPASALSLAYASPWPERIIVRKKGEWDEIVVEQFSNLGEGGPDGLCNS
jgi:DNA repair protein RadD